MSTTSCMINKEKETVKQGGSYSFQPEPLDDEWNNWLVGEWDCRAESDVGEGTGRIKIEPGLNGQFLFMKGEAQTSEMTPEQIKYVKETLYATDEDIERLQSSSFKELQIHTIDPKTGERIGYLFDSMRCIAKGKGKLEGNKEIMQWKWSGQAQGATSTRIIEKISDNKFTLYHKYILPNGNIMEDKGVMTRKAGK